MKKLWAGATLALVVGGIALASDKAGGSAGDKVPVVDGPTAAPTPTPSPTPTTTPPTPESATPSLSGLAPVAAAINYSSYLVRSWGTGAIPRVESPGVEGAFRFSCTPSHNAYDDPIVYPGQPGKAHLHTFFGNTGTNANSTYQSLRTSGESSCNNLLNRSAYWIPAMMNGSGRVVMPNMIGIYYKRAPQGSKWCSQPYAQACLPLPRGLRYVFGYDMANPGKSDPKLMRWFNCDGPGAKSGRFATMADALKGCPAGAKLGAIIVGPNCWNGKQLDTPDHRSHMAYQDWGDWGYPRCPATHPYLLPFFEASAWYTNDGSAWSWHFSSDRMAGMPSLAPGTSFHADWFGAWDDVTQNTWTANCIDKALSCAGGDLGMGLQLAMLQGYNYNNRTNLVLPPARP
jgi:hypothetical protein